VDKREAEAKAKKWQSTFGAKRHIADKRRSRREPAL
jgi:hypothetical protein